MAVDVYLAGLMLVCFDGQPNCPVHGAGYGNTAWVVKVDSDMVKPCGWESRVKARLELRFKKTEIDPGAHGLSCSDEGEETSCDLSEHVQIYVKPDPKPMPRDQRLEASLQWLPRINEVDYRFKAVDEARLKLDTYISNRIHFPTGVIGAGARWPPEGNPRLWLRSNGDARGALPRELSDRVKVTYETARKIVIAKEDEAPLITLTPKPGVDSAQVVLRNRGENLEPDKVGGFNDLTYLRWYYRLGTWGRTECPRDAVLLRCFQEREGRDCYWYGNFAADTKFWPTVLRPGY